MESTLIIIGIGFFVMFALLLTVFITACTDDRPKTQGRDSDLARIRLIKDMEYLHTSRYDSSKTP